MDARAHLIVLGMVQGVGFRYFAQRLAQQRNLTGWVKNRPDGKVEIVAEGHRGMIEDFIKDLRTGHPYAKVKEIDTHWEPYTAEFSRFDLVY
jgi:acylphosphatase